MLGYLYVDCLEIFFGYCRLKFFIFDLINNNDFVVRFGLNLF